MAKIFIGVMVWLSMLLGVSQRNMNIEQTYDCTWKESVHITTVLIAPVLWLSIVVSDNERTVRPKNCDANHE